MLSAKGIHTTPKLLPLSQQALIDRQRTTDVSLQKQYLTGDSSRNGIKSSQIAFEMNKCPLIIFRNQFMHLTFLCIFFGDSSNMQMKMRLTSCLGALQVIRGNTSRCSQAEGTQASSCFKVSQTATNKKSITFKLQGCNDGGKTEAIQTLRLSLRICTALLCC